MSNPTIFSRIIAGDIPTDFIYQDEFCVCFKDIHPQAPTHVLIVPREPLPTLASATEQHHALLGHLMLKAGHIARLLGVSEAFRLVVNNGAGAGQTVFHLHLHLMANKKFTEQALMD